MNKECPECQGRINGRADKKFCSELCRNSHNNRLNSEMNNYMRNVNSALRRNRRILREFLSLNATAISRNLIRQGFDPSYYTHMEKGPKGKAIYFCYEYGFQQVEDDRCLLVKREVDKG